MFETILMFGDSMEISDSKLTDVANAVFETIKKELPEEAQIYEICECVLERCKDKLRKKRIGL